MEQITKIDNDDIEKKNNNQKINNENNNHNNEMNKREIKITKLPEWSIEPPLEINRRQK